MSWVISFAFTVHWFEGWCKHILRWSMKLSGNVVTVIFNVLSAFKLTAKHTWYTLPFKRLVSLFVRFSFFFQQEYWYAIIYVIISTKKNLFLTLIIIRHIYWAANQHIRMISEESCDTEDWSNDAENSALHHRKILHFIFKCTIHL